MLINTLFDAGGVPINRTAYNTLLGGSTETHTRSAKELILYAKENPLEPIIRGLVNKGDILLLHGVEETFKSVLVLQMAEGLALGRPLLQTWDVPKPRRVGVIETEIHEVALGERLEKMFPSEAPENLLVMGEKAMPDWRRRTMDGKFEIIQGWIDEVGIELLMIDTVNDFFRGNDDSSVERHAGKFFDELRNLRVNGRIIVRHDRKRRADGEEGSNTNERIRGSGEWKEDPEAILFVERPDHRTHEVNLEVGKLRYGRKRPPISAWFDAKTFRLTPLPPVIAMLAERECSRRDLISGAKERFDLCERKVDEILFSAHEFLIERQAGHEKCFSLDLERARNKAPWWEFLS